MKYLLILTFLWSSVSAYSFQVKDKIQTDDQLSKKIAEVLAGFEGDAGVYVYHFDSHTEVAIRADEVFPTASMIKVPIMLSLFEKIEAGDLDYNQKVVYKDSLYYSGDDILGSFKDSEPITISKLVMLMITMSDNTASLWCQQLAGTGTSINHWLKTAGMKHTRVNSRTPGREKDQEKYGWGQTTPREMASLLRMIHTAEAVSPAASEEMLRVLGAIYWRSEALSQIPPAVATASKQGAVSQSRSEVVLVNAPSGPYVFCIITKNQQDTSWDHDNAGYQLIRDVSRALWYYFEPDYNYAPSGSDKWLK